MKGAQASHARLEVTAEQRSSRDVLKLVRKLRWIGLEAEAEELQAILNRLPDNERGACLAEPRNTD
jgi:hypothetical protein